MPFIGNKPTAVPLSGADIEDGTIGLADLSATGTKDATTFLRGDNTFAEAGGGGKLLQVVTATTTTSTTTNSTSFVTGNLSVNITPSATSSKILVCTGGSMDNEGSGVQMGATIYRDSTNLGHSTGGLFSGYGSGRVRLNTSMITLDSPSTTSTLTYTVYIRSYGGETIRFNSDSVQGTIVAMEVGA